MRRNRRMGDIRLVQDLVKSKAGMRNVRILIPTGYGLDHDKIQQDTEDGVCNEQGEHCGEW